MKILFKIKMPPAPPPPPRRRRILVGLGLAALLWSLAGPWSGPARGGEDEDGVPSAVVSLNPLPAHDDAQVSSESSLNLSSSLDGANVIVHQEVVHDAELSHLAHEHAPGLTPEQERFPPMERPVTKKYFMYQPSGGWGNQRYILRWAIIAANAMKRTLVVAPIAPHSDIWHGFNDFNKSDLCNAALVLDVKALEEAADYGVVFLDDLPVRAFEAAKQAGLSVKEYTKPHFKRGTTFWRLFESRIAETWGNVPEDVVFWDKGSMWLCCLTDDASDSVWYGRHIMFNARFKAAARLLAQPMGTYNAVHVRRGDHALNDRKSAERYYKIHNLAIFDKKLPLYIATDETFHEWFRYFRKKGGFTKLVFWNNLNRKLIDELLADYPRAFHSDALGFLEQLICGNAAQWEGSRESTFSAAISTIRMVPALRNVNWSFPAKPSVRKKAQLSTLSTSVLDSGDTYSRSNEEGDDGN